MLRVPHQQRMLAICDEGAAALAGIAVAMPGRPAGVCGVRCRVKPGGPGASDRHHVRDAGLSGLVRLGGLFVLLDKDRR